MVRIASIGNPNGYSGIGVAGLTMTVIVAEGGVCWIVIELGPNLPPVASPNAVPEIPPRVGWIIVGSLK